MLEQVTCLAAVAGRTWTDDWKVGGFAVRVEVYRLSHHPRGGEHPIFETYCADERAAARQAERYERRGYVARVVPRGD